MDHIFNKLIFECNNFSLEEKLKLGINNEEIKEIFLSIFYNIIDDNHSLIEENKKKELTIDILNNKIERISNDSEVNYLKEIIETKDNIINKKFKNNSFSNIEIDNIIDKKIFEFNNYNILEKIKYGIRNNELKDFLSDLYIEFKSDYENIMEVQFKESEFIELNNQIDNLNMEIKKLKQQLREK